MRLLSFFNRQAAAIVLFASGLTACGGGYDPSLAPALAPAVTPEITQVTLTGEQEAPNVITTAAIGNATLSLNRSARTISATITTDGMVPTLAHIHAAEAGSAGPVVFPMTVSGSTVTLAPTVLSTDQLATLDAGGFYFNVHSAANPAGEIRGQIGREVFVAHLTGSQESPPSTSTATGEGRLVLDPITRKVSGEIELQGIQATIAHVHTGAVGVNGPVLIGLVDHGGHGHFTVPEDTVMTVADVDKLRLRRPVLQRPQCSQSEWGDPRSDRPANPARLSLWRTGGPRSCHHGDRPGVRRLRCSHPARGRCAQCRRVFSDCRSHPPGVRRRQWTDHREYGADRRRQQRLGSTSKRRRANGRSGESVACRRYVLQCPLARPSERGNPWPASRAR